MMKRLLFLLFLLTPLLSQPLSARTWTISKVLCVGNKRVQTETILSYVALGKQMVITDEILDAALKNLYKTGLFEDVSFTMQADNVLVITVKETPIVNKIFFEGSTKLSDDTLRADLLLKSRAPYTKRKLEADVNRILQLFSKNGYFAAKVTPKLIYRTQNRVDVVFELFSGAKRKIEKILFSGNHVFSDRTLRKVIISKERKGLRFSSATSVYDNDRIAYDQSLIMQYYLSRGYADVKVTASVTELMANQQALVLTFVIEEGDLYRYGKITVDSEVSYVDLDALRKRITLKPGHVYNYFAVDDLVDSLIRNFKQGHDVFLTIMPKLSLNHTASTVDLHFLVQQAPYQYVDKIRIYGNTRTYDRVIRRELLIVEGDAFNDIFLKQSERRLMATGFFANVSITTEPASKEGWVVLNVSVKEQPTGRFMIGGGYSNLEGFSLQIDFGENNFMGTGRGINLTLDTSKGTSSINFSYTEPRFRGLPLSATLHLYKQNYKKGTYYSYNGNTIGTGVSFGWRYTSNLTQSARYSLTRTFITDLPEATSDLLKDKEGVSYTSSVGYTLNYNLTNNYYYPTRGLALRWSQDLAGLGGHNKYLRTTAKYSHYYPLSQTFTLQTIFKIGHVTGIGQGTIKSGQRFNLGGHEFLGFDYWGIGPRDKRRLEALGGNFYYLAEGSVKFPISQGLGFFGKFFLLAGNLSKIDAGSNVGSYWDSSKIRLTTGFAFIWNSPAGQLQFSWTKVLRSEPYDRTQYFLFSIGTLF